MLLTVPSPAVQSRMSVATPVSVMTTVSPAKRPDVTVPVWVTTRAAPARVTVRFSDLLLGSVSGRDQGVVLVRSLIQIIEARRGRPAR